ETAAGADHDVGRCRVGVELDRVHDALEVLIAAVADGLCRAVVLAQATRGADAAAALAVGGAGRTGCSAADAALVESLADPLPRSGGKAELAGVRAGVELLRVTRRFRADDTAPGWHEATATRRRHRTVLVAGAARAAVGA